MGGMEKTTVYLTTAQKAALERTAAVEGRSEARLIRAGIDVVTARHRVAEAPAGLLPVETAAAGSASPTGRPRWLTRDEFARVILRHQADPGLRDELRELAPDTTDESSLE
jgi:hypothetical protein